MIPGHESTGTEHALKEFTSVSFGSHETAPEMIPSWITCLICITRDHLERFLVVRAPG